MEMEVIRLTNFHFPSPSTQLTNFYPLSLLLDSYQASILSMLYLYIILQLVGLLWAFVTNAAVSLGLMVAKEIGSGNLSVLVWIRKREMVATFYVIYSTFRVVMQFLNCCVSTVWQSLNDFPKARRQITGTQGLRSLSRCSLRSHLSQCSLRSQASQPKRLLSSLSQHLLPLC